MSERTRFCSGLSLCTDSSSARWARTMSAMSKRPALSGPVTLPALLWKQVERTRCFAHELFGYPRVTSGRLNARMPEQRTDHAKVGPLFEQVRRETMTQGVGAHVFIHPCLLRCVRDRLTHCRCA